MLNKYTYVLTILHGKTRVQHKTISSYKTHMYIRAGPALRTGDGRLKMFYYAHSDTPKDAQCMYTNMYVPMYGSYSSTGKHGSC